MATEHNISTLVMLSGEKAWQYWEEDQSQSDGVGVGAVATFGALTVMLDSKEKLPSFMKREFTVRNTKVVEGFWLCSPPVCYFNHFFFFLLLSRPAKRSSSLTLPTALGAVITPVTCRRLLMGSWTWWSTRRHTRPRLD